MPKQKTPSFQELIEAIDENIRRRAYQLFESRGREHGHDVEDWLLAESEITGQWPVSARKKNTSRSKTRTAAA